MKQLSSGQSSGTGKVRKSKVAESGVKLHGRRFHFSRFHNRSKPPGISGGSALYFNLANSEPFDGSKWENLWSHKYDPWLPVVVESA